MKAEGISPLALSRKLGCDYNCLRKWLKLESVKPVRTQGSWSFYDEGEATAAVRPHLAKSKKRETDADKNIDPETGLTWSQAKMREQAIAQRLENAKEERKLSEEWGLIADFERLLKSLTDRIEQLPGKVRGEAGLTEAQAKIVQRECDAMRTDAAAEIRRMAEQ